jgi:hypothetical protein
MNTYSILYLPTGARICTHTGWHQQAQEDGTINLYSIDGANTFLGSIHKSGVVHLSTELQHTYIPAGDITINEAFAIVGNNLHDLSHDQLAHLKKETTSYNVQKKMWR